MAEYGWTKQGAVKITKADGNRVLAALPKRKGKWISKSHLLAVPKSIRMFFKTNFDQDCGCTAVVDCSGNTFEAYNVYGSMKKYASSKQNTGLKATPHMRRKFLKEEGFVRARGIRKNNKEVARKLYDYAMKGYRVAEKAPAKKAPAKVAPVAAPAAPAVTA